MSEADKIKTEADQVAEYKEKYKVIKKIVSEDGQHVLWLRSPSRLAVGVFMAEVTNSVTTACEYIFNDACVREISDVDYFQKDENFYGIIRELQTLIRVKKNTSMNL